MRIIDCIGYVGLLAVIFKLVKNLNMSIFTTYMYINGIKFSGKRISAISWEEADFRAKHQGLELAGRLVLEVPCNQDYVPDWEKAIDYELVKNN